MDARKVLMLCYFYPPVQTAGVARSVGFASRLARHGWKPTVLTVTRAHDGWDLLGTDYPVPQGIDVLRAPELNLIGPVNLLDTVVNKSLRALRVNRRYFVFRDWLCIPDPQITWRAVGAGRAIAADHDCIYATCSPFSSALKGVQLKRATGKPLVVDFRDPWTLNPHVRRPSPIRLRLLKRLERRIISCADRLILNTEGTLALYREAYPEYSHRFVSIPNGYDRLNLPDARPDVFTVMHVGSFYGTRRPTALMEALLELNLPGLRFVQVGPDSADLDPYRQRLRIEVTGPVPPEQALAQMRKASLLYLKLGWSDGVRAYPSVVMKTYEYLATGWPILADCPPGDNAEMVRRYGQHAHVVSNRTPAAHRAALRAAVLQAYQRRHAVEPRVSDAFRIAFDRDRLTARLADVFSEVRTLQAGQGFTETEQPR
ncbi:MAG: glycosyltransferase [Aquisalimonadaceae bacterium]